jgi:hypothetical protein
MTKFRKNTHDAPERVTPKRDTPGKVGVGKIAVYDGKGRMRGQVGPKATAATVSRFHGQLGSKLGTGPDGKPAWLAPTLGKISAQGSATPGAQGDTLADVSSRGVTATQVKTGGSNG